MNILYVSYLCPDCPPAEEQLNQEGIAYEKKDISKSLKNLKAFLALRDSREEFNEIKEKGQIGVPLLVREDNELLFF